MLNLTVIKFCRSKRFSQQYSSCRESTLQVKLSIYVFGLHIFWIRVAFENQNINKQIAPLVRVHAALRNQRIDRDEEDDIWKRSCMYVDNILYFSLTKKKKEN